MRNFNPKSVQDSETLITRVQEGFGAGMFDDIPSSKIPKNGVKYSENYYLHNDSAKPRGGCRLWGKWSTGVAHSLMPSLRTGYSLTKSGTTVTKTVGDNFTAADVGNYIIYDDGGRERITAYLNGSQVTMDRDDARAASTAAKVGGPINLIKQHKIKKNVILHIDTRIFISDDPYISNWIECFNATPEFALDSSVSIYDEKDNYAFLYNPTGTFKLDLNDVTDLTNNPPIYFKINTPVPTVKISEVESDADLPYIRKYIYCMSRIGGNGANRDRHSGTIEQISGPTAVDDDFKDYGSVATSRPVGLADTTFETLVGGALTSPNDSISWWANDTTLEKMTGGDVGTSYDEYTEWLGISDGEFTIVFSSVAYNVTGMDFSAVTSMGSLTAQVSGSVAEVIENAINSKTLRSETVRWDQANTRFIVRSDPDYDDSTTLSYAYTYAGGGTDISAITKLDSGSASITQETSKDTSDMQFRITIDGENQNISFDASGVTTFTQLAEAIETALQDVFGSHVLCNYDTDHFEISSEVSGGTVGFAVQGDDGFNGVNIYLELDNGGASITSSLWTVQSQISELTIPLNTVTGNQISHWTHYSVFGTLDVGVNGINPQTGRGNNSELFVLIGDIPVAKAFVCGRSGNIVTASEGEFSINDVGSTLKFQSGIEVVISAYISTTQVNTSTSGTITSQSACIGGGLVMTASQSGTTITRTGGSSFSVNDVGRQLFWSDGRRSIITEYTNSNSVQAYPSQTVSSQGATINPVSRSFNDTIEDTTLRNRIGGYSLQNRFFEPLPNCDTGIIIGVFMWVAIRGEEKVYYSQIPAGEIYRVGYYNSDKQVAALKDKIVHLREFQDRLVIYCTNSTRGIPTNTFETEEIEEIGEVVAVAAGQFVIDQGIGLLDYGSLRKIPHGRDLLITNEPAIRDFNGLGYSKIDYSYNRIRKKIMKLENETASAYHRELGYVLWGLEE